MTPHNDPQVTPLLPNLRFTPEKLELQVAFYLPQLVQQLRADPGGLVEAFLLDGAAKSQLFAHHLICTLRVRLKVFCYFQKQRQVDIPGL